MRCQGGRGPAKRRAKAQPQECGRQGLVRESGIHGVMRATRPVDTEEPGARDCSTSVGVSTAAQRTKAAERGEAHPKPGPIQKCTRPIMVKLMYAKCICIYNKIDVLWGCFYVNWLSPAGVSSPRSVLRMASGRCPCVSQ
jgi:hypothetical protein